MAEIPSLKDIVDTMNEMIRISHNELVALMQQNHQESQEQFASISQRIVTLETRSPTRGSRANSLGSHGSEIPDRDQQQETKGPQKEDLREGDALDDMQLRFDEEEDEKGRTSMNRVTRRSGEDIERSKYRKTMSMVTKQANDGSVLPTLTVPPFQYRLNSTSPSAILKFQRNWVRYQLQYKVPVNPLTCVSEGILRKIRHTQHVTDDDLRSCNAEEFCMYLANDLVMVNKLMFFKELEEALSTIPRLKWHGVGLLEHETFYNELLYRQERVLEYFNFFKENKDNRDAIPKVAGKFGTAKLFLNLIDEEYNEPILALIPELKDKNYQKLEDFISCYMREADRQFEITRAVINGVPFSSNKAKKPERDKAYADKSSFKKREYVRDDDRKRDWVANRFKPRQEQQVNHLSDNPLELHDSDEDAWELQWDEEIVRARTLYEDDREEPERLSDDPEDHDPEIVIPPDILNNIDPVMPTLAGQFNQQDKVYGCLYYTIYGKCLKGDKCKYAKAHNRQGARDTSEWIIKRLGSNDRLDSDAPKKRFSMKRN
jgi:hemoglobin-like flavoprotein